MRGWRCLLCASLLSVPWIPGARADLTLFNTGSPDGLIGTATRPDAGGKAEIESADDFVATGGFKVTGATFTGLLTGGATPANIGEVVVEIYRVFPKDSTVPPSGNVLTRVNSPSDVAFDTRDSAASSLSFTTATLSTNFTAMNSVLNGINKSPNQTTGGEGAIRGNEVQFTVSFATPFLLPEDHYFFVPQVQVTGGDFYWLSAPRPIAAAGTPFPPGSTDLQSWIRNDALDPDWSRVGTDVVGPINGVTPAPSTPTFSLKGVGVPEPSSMALLGLGALALAAGARRRARRKAVRVGTT